MLKIKLMMNAMLSKCLRGEDCLKQYFKEFIKLVAVTEKNICFKEYLSFIKNIYLF